MCVDVRGCVQLCVGVGRHVPILPNFLLRGFKRTYGTRILDMISDRIPDQISDWISDRTSDRISDFILPMVICL